jgi:transcriptional regulator with XRE-family HTH domain
MMPADSRPSREDVLYAFAVEPTLGRDTLDRYLRDYPEYTVELIDLSFELSREVCEDETPLSNEEQALIDRAWQRYVEAAPKDTIDPFATLSVAVQRELAQRLDVPRQVITAFREQRVEPASVPLPFLERLAAALNSTVEILISTLELPPEPNLARNYKADSRPETHTQASFEQILIEANVSPDKRALLIKGES